ncbi:tryptophan-rich sensory protein [Leifsonia sp. YIM 134122]|uniref:Tryptophan-rich sensory protein n=1 Tax=Leifsonia stereocauli TaxID=3134136 RepID=A0ABU9W724_9MICO
MAPQTQQSATGSDYARMITVAVSAVIAVVGSFIGSGAAGGTPIQDAAGGALAADATVVAPGSGAFSIWSVIYAGLLAYAVWQFFPAQRTAERQRRLGYWIAASLILNAAWILSIQFDQLLLSIPIIIALLLVLIRCFLLARRYRGDGVIDAIITDGTIGLYLGWVTIATVANITAGLVAVGFDGFGLEPDVWGVIVIAVAGLIGIGLALRGEGRLAPTASLCWGIAWVAIARLTGDLMSTPTAMAAITAVVVIVIVTIVARLRATTEDPDRVPAATMV